MGRKLDLKNFNLGCQSAKVLGDLIIRNQNFASLLLSENFLGNDGLRILADSLPH